MSFLFFAMGIVLLILGSKIKNYYKKSVRGAQKLNGKIVAHVRKYTSSRALSPLVEVHVHGQDRYVLSPFGSSPPSGKVGDVVDVFLDPHDSNRAATQIGMIPKVCTVMQIIGLVLILLSAYIFHVFGKHFALFDMFFLVVIGATAALNFKKKTGHSNFKRKWSELKRKFSFYSEFISEERAQAMISGQYEPEEKFGKVGELAKEAIVNRKPATKKEASGALSPLLTILGASLIVFAVVKTQEVLEFKRTATRVSAVIIDQQVNRGSGTTYTPIISFSPGPGQREIQFKGDFGSSHPSWRVGDPVHVFFDPSEPENAILDDGLWNHLMSIILGFIGLVLMVVGISNWPSGIQKYKTRRPGEPALEDRRIS